MKPKHLIISFLVISLLILRFINLINIPIFGDESLYINFAKNINQNFKNHYLDSISYGVFPVFIWLQAFFHQLFNSTINPLLLSRIVAVVADIISTIFIYLIGKKIYGRIYGYISTIIYLILPLTFFHSRLALLESTTHMLMIIAIYLSVLGIKSTSLLKRFNSQWILTMAIILTLAFFTKPLAIISFAPVFLVPLFFKSKIVHMKTSKNIWLNYFTAFLLTGIIIALLYIPVKHHFSKFIFTSNLFSFQAIGFFLSNLIKAFSWSRIYFTPPLLFIIITVFIYSLLKRKLPLLWLSFWLIQGLLLSSFFGSYFFPRHLFLLASPATFLVSYSFYKLIKKNNPSYLLLCFVLCVPAIYLLIQIINNPHSANIAGEDKQQLYENWNSGVGLFEISQKINQISKQQRITVLIENDPSIIWPFNYLYKLNNVNIITSDQLLNQKDINFHQIANQINDPIYFIIAINQDFHPNKNNQLILSIPRGSNYSISLYQAI
ncbi:MAG: glycosyltransferase family 39 protein [Candidatus Beckwithbacteria bacterium]